MRFFFVCLVSLLISSVGMAATKTPSKHSASASCPCSGSKYCTGSRGGQYCITSGGTKRYAKKRK